MSSPSQATYPVATAGVLLDFLTGCRPGTKKTTARQWLKFGLVEVNGQTVVQARHELKPGDVVTIGNKQQSVARSTLPLNLSIVFEDEHLIVVDKPHNLLSVSSDGEKERTVHAFLTDYIRGGNSRNSRRLWIVHRLDRATSGLMIFARTEEAQQLLKEQWPEVEKTYLALIKGELPQSQGTLVSHLDETSPVRVYSAPPSERTRKAVTHYKVLKRKGNVQLLELRLETGRRNQLRVQLADEGCPILGDRIYGSAESAPRLALHSTSLKFRHPVTGKQLSFESPLPRSLAQIVE